MHQDRGSPLWDAAKPDRRPALARALAAVALVGGGASILLWLATRYF